VARDIILAGIPRGGTTLACVLLNSLTNTVALNEPFNLSELAAQADPQKKISWLKKSFAIARKGLIENRTALSKGKHGKLVSNMFENAPSQTSPRLNTASLQSISFPYLNKTDFSLVVKHPNAFTVLLPLLRGHFECFAIVRNPLAVALSWDTTEANWRKGRVPLAERLDRLLFDGLQQRKSVADRQIFILAHYFRTTKNALPVQQIIRYEDIVSTGGKALRAITEEAAELQAPLSNANANPVYNRDKVRFYTDSLLEFSADWAPFYSAKDIIDTAHCLNRTHSKEIMS